jgi:cyclic pyranopterin phosphate synthase
MPEEDYEFTPVSRLMQSDEIEKIARIFVEAGVNKIRLTGGEPLVRKDAADIITRLSVLPVQLTLTTNATRVHEFVDVLEHAKIKSINISLDTLEAEKFNLITRRNQFEKVLSNIHMLLDRNFHVKVNVVVMKGLNDNEISSFIEWTRHTPVHIRFIEFMPFTGNRWTSNKLFTLQEMLERIREHYEITPLHNDLHDTARKFSIPGHAGSFAVISTMSEPFCAGCNRMRLTADGKLKNCLFSKGEMDLLTPLRNGQDILPLIHESIQSKAKELGGQFDKNFESLLAGTIENRSMITIGG